MGKKGKEIQFPYGALQPADVVCCDVRGIFPVFTRLFSGGGFRHAFDHSVSTHTGILIPIGNQLFIGEMSVGGIRLNSLEARYKSHRRKVMAFRRLPKLTMPERRQIVNSFAWLYRHEVEYDPKGLLEFVHKRIDDNPKRYYCSEMVYQITKQFADYPSPFETKVSPQHLYQTDALMTVWHR